MVTECTALHYTYSHPAPHLFRPGHPPFRLSMHTHTHTYAMQQKNSHLFIQEAPCAHKLVGEAHPPAAVKAEGNDLAVTIKRVAARSLC